jgi:ApaG protein
MVRSASSDTCTQGIRVHAAAQYLPEESDPGQKHWLYVYRIRITNEGEQPARLRARHWVILDSENERRDVRGPGVVGRYPDLAPGESFEYFSSCPLPTTWGTMEGTYTFERPDGDSFQVVIGRFFLVPNAPPVLEPSTAQGG